MSNTTSKAMTAEEFDRLFREVSNWGRWGADERGTLNFITPESTRRAASLVRAGRSVSMARPINTVAAADNPDPAIHHMTQCYDIPGEGGNEPQFVADYLGCSCHGNAHSHIDALCHVAYRGRLYNDRPTEEVTSRGAKAMDIAQYSGGIVGRGVLLDIPRLRKAKWLEPGEAVTGEELEAAERAEGVRLAEGDIFVFRVGHYQRRLELGPWKVDSGGEGRAGLHPTAMKLLHERRVAAFMPDGDGETVPSPVQGIGAPVHALQIAAMGLACGDSLQLEELAKACEEEGRWEFMVVVSPLRLRGGTGSLVNPIAIL